MENHNFADEAWKEIKGSEGLYYISTYGRIKSFTRDKIDGRLMKQSRIKNFLTVNIKLFGKQKTHLVHKLVIEAFIEKPNTDSHFISHKDFNSLNNQINNLTWVTREENYDRVMKHLAEINKNAPGKMMPYSKLKAEDVKVIKTMLAKGIKQKMIARMFCISEMQITRIKQGVNWSEVEVEVDESSN